jgi:hypothetical protein
VFPQHAALSFRQVRSKSVISTQEAHQRHLAKSVGRQSGRSGGGPAHKPFHDFPHYGTTQGFFKGRVPYFLVVPHFLA